MMIFEENNRKGNENQNAIKSLLEQSEEARFREKYPKLFNWLDSHYAGDYKIIIDRLKKEKMYEI